MRIELSETDMRCLKAIRAAGGYAKLSDCLFRLYQWDTVFSYEEICASFTRLLQGKLICACLSFKERLYRITRRGRAALLGDKISFEGRKIEMPFTNRMFLEAREEGLLKWKMWQDGTLKIEIYRNIFFVALWILSLVLLVGGVLFACLYQGSIGWRIGVGITGGALYMVVGTVGAFLCVGKCSNRIEAFLTIVNLPAYGLLLAVLHGA